jgi:hypothetical protein
MERRFIFALDQDVARALDKLAQAQDRSRAAVLRVLVKSAARQLEAEITTVSPLSSIAPPPRVEQADPQTALAGEGSVSHV